MLPGPGDNHVQQKPGDWYQPPRVPYRYTWITAKEPVQREKNLARTNPATNPPIKAYARLSSG